MSEEKDNQNLVLIGAPSDTKKISVGIILVALYAVLSLLPMSGFIGVGGVSSLLSFAICVAPIIGIVLGPLRGFGFGLIAGIIGAIINLSVGVGVFLIIPTTILGPAIAALFTGFSLKRTTTVAGHAIPGPLITALYLVIIIILYETSKYEAWWFMSPYMLAAIVAVILQIKNFEFNPKQSYLQLLPLTFIGAMLDHSMMAMGSVYLLDLPSALFGFGIFPVMIIERIIAALLGALLGFIILKVFGEEITG